MSSCSPAAAVASASLRQMRLLPLRPPGFLPARTTSLAGIIKPTTSTTPLALSQFTRAYQGVPPPSSSSPYKYRKRRKKLPFIDVGLTPASAEEAVNNILYNNSPQAPAPVTRHVLNCLVSNEPGVLSRISGILAARGFNIDSLVVAKTEVPDLSRMTMVLNGQKPVIEQAKRQLEDLVPVWAVLDYTHSRMVERELLLLKVWAVPHEHLNDDGETEVEGLELTHEVHDFGAETKTTLSPLLGAALQRQAITELARLFNARIVDVGIDSVVVELCAKPDRIDAFIKLMKPYGIIEAARSGTMAMQRTPVDIYHEDEANKEESEEPGSTVDATMLPPG
ncbi:hypothetical protein HK102_010410 [Quaeritorhiza haematococci]|nr:hypothetical protein HK102_010410 [Quaeritorhiza haematococci]